jgi:hypothetical protein
MLLECMTVCPEVVFYLQFYKYVHLILQIGLFICLCIGVYVSSGYFACGWFYVNLKLIVFQLLLNIAGSQLRY